MAKAALSNTRIYCAKLLGNNFRDLNTWYPMEFALVNLKRFLWDQKTLHIATDAFRNYYIDVTLISVIFQTYQQLDILFKAYWS